MNLTLEEKSNLDMHFNTWNNLEMYMGRDLGPELQDLQYLKIVSSQGNVDLGGGCQHDIEF